jgi:hypothetical protein
MPGCALSAHASLFAESEKQGLDTLVTDRILKSYAIDPDCRESMLNELWTLGVTTPIWMG